MLWVLRAATLVAVASAAQYDPEAELAAYPDFQEGLKRYRHHHRRHHGRRHLRGHHHNKMALTVHSDAPRLNWSPDDDADQAEKVAAKAAMNPMSLPGRHPSVEKALGNMGGDLEELKEKKMVAQETRGELEGTVSQAVSHMNDAMSIKHAIAAKEAQMRKAKNKLLNLEREARHNDETHKSLVTSLHRVLEPKLEFARERLQKKEMVLEREAKATKGWEEKKDVLHSNALERLKAKKAAHESLLQAEHAVAVAKEEQVRADKVDRYERQRTSQEVQSFRYADTRFKAEITHQKAAEEAAVAARASVQKLNNVLAVESEKVEESVEVNKNRIHHKMEEVEAGRQKNAEELASLEGRYREWQENQRQRAAEVVRKSHDTAIAAQAYANRQKQVLDSATTKVVHDAEAKSDWAPDTWENGFNNDAGFADSNPSLSD